MTATPAPIAAGSFKPLDSWRRRWKLVLLLMLGGWALGPPLAMLKGQPVYQVTGTLVIAPKFASVLRDDKELDLPSTTQYKQFVEQQMRTINRYDVMVKVLERLGAQRTLWQRDGESERKAAERLQAALQIRNLQLAYLVLISLESNTPDGLEVLVNTVMQVYLEVSRQESLYASDERITTLEQRVEQILQELSAITERRALIAQELGVTTFSADAANPYDTLILDARKALEDTQRRRQAAEAKLNNLEPTQKAGRANLDALAREQLSTDYGLNSLKASLLSKRADILERSSGLTAEHPERVVMERKLKELDSELNSAQDKALELLRRQLLDRASGEVRELRSLETQLRSSIEQQQSQAQQFASRYHEALNLGADIERLRRQLQTVEDRIDYLRLESSAPGFVRIDSLARPALEPVGGGKKKWLLLCFALGLVSGLGLPLALDIADRRLRTPGQLHKLLGFAPLGVLIEHQPEQIEQRRLYQHQLRQLSLSLERNRLRHPLQLLLVCGVRLASGSTRLALELAREFEQNGTSVLLLELDALHPDPLYVQQHLPLGLRQVLEQQVTLEQVIQAPSGELPTRLGLGISVEPTLGLYTQLRLQLEQLRQCYELIVIDGPPLLLSPDTGFLAALSDACLVVVAAGQISPGELRRALQLLERAEPASVGVVLNRAPLLHGGYYQQLLRDYTEIEQSVTARHYPRGES